MNPHLESSLDISVRKQAESELQATMQRFYHMLSSMYSGVLLMTGEGRVEFVNQAFCDAYGLHEAPAELVGMSSADLLAKILPAFGDPAAAASRIGEILQHGQPVKGEEFAMRAGRMALRDFVPLRSNGKSAGRLWIYTDITKHKRAEEALRESDLRFRLAAAATEVGIWERNLLTNQLRWDSQMFRIYGITPTEDGLIAYADWRGAVLPEDLPEQEQILRDTVRRGGQGTRSFRIWRRSDGQCRYIQAVDTVRTNVHGQVEWVLGTNLDITEHKLAEAQIKATLAEKEVLLREIHHRVKNNLQVISSLVSLQADSLADEGLRPLFDDVRDRVRAIALVHEMLYQTSDLARLNLAEYAASLLQYLWRSHGTLAGKVRLQLAIAPVVLVVETAVTCGLILNELAGNALKHAFPGGREGEVTVGLDADPTTGMACLWVRDNGVGLPPGLDWRQTRTLGLRLVRLLASQLRGTLATGAGPGTEFQVSFSLKEGES